MSGKRKFNDSVFSEEVKVRRRVGKTILSEPEYNRYDKYYVIKNKDGRKYYFYVNDIDLSDKNNVYIDVTIYDTETGTVYPNRTKDNLADLSLTLNDLLGARTSKPLRTHNQNLTNILKSAKRKIGTIGGGRKKSKSKTKKLL
jgi:hypothetical protein